MHVPKSSNEIHETPRDFVNKLLQEAVALTEGPGQLAIVGSTGTVCLHFLLQLQKNGILGQLVMHI